jgi:TolB-like protein
MKRRLFAVLTLLAALSVYGQAKDRSLDGAIQNAARQIQNDLAKDETIVVYQFNSHNPQLSDHILKELFDDLVNSHKFKVLDRSSQEVIDAELDFQYITSAEMISEDSLASLTKRLGAKAIITGSLDKAGNEYRFRVKGIGTETTEAVFSFTASVDKNDLRIREFEGRKSISQNLLTGVLNIAVGAGSFIEGDKKGGFVPILVGYAVAGGLIAAEKAFLDWGDDLVGYPVTIGFFLAGGTVIYGFARPFIYNRAPRVTAVLDNAKLNIVTVSDTTGNLKTGFQAAYTIKF